MSKDQQFIQLYDTYWHQLYAFAFNILRNKHDTEDVIQNVFVDIWNRYEAIQIENHKAYLYKAVKFQCAKKLKSTQFNHIQIENIEYALQFLDQQISEQNKAKEELIEKIDAKANDILPERCLEIFKLRYYDNLSYKDIAEKLNISRSTVDNQISKALRLLRLSNINYDDVVALSIFLSLSLFSFYYC